MRWRIWARVALLAIAAACGGDGAPGAGSVVVDTLGGGAVVTTSTGPGPWGPEDRRLVEVLRIGSAEDDAYGFSRIMGLTVDASSRIWVLDGQTRTLRVFDDSGALVRTIGREGQGPGEFRAPAALFPGDEGRVWAVDMGNQRYTAFDSGGAVVEEHPRSVPGRLDEASPRRIPGGYIDAGAGIWGRLSTATLFRLGPSMAKTDSLAIGLSLEETERTWFDLPDDAPFVIPIPWAEDIAWAPSADGSVWVARAREYALARRSLSGDTLAVIRRRVDPPAVTAAERDSALARLDSLSDLPISAQADRVPATKPYLLRLFETEDPAPDAGALWVQREVGADEPGSRFDVFDADGRYLGSARAPVRIRGPIAFVGDRLYGTTRDAVGIPWVVVLELAPPG